MATRTEHRFIQRELVRSTVIFFVVLAGMLFVLGFSIYRQISDNLFESIDAQLRMNCSSLVTDIRWGETAPGDDSNAVNIDASEDPREDDAAYDASEDSQEDDEDYDASADAGFPVAFIKAVELNLEGNPQLIFIIRDVKGSLANAISLYTVYPDYLNSISFDANTLDTPQLQLCEGHYLRTLSAELRDDSQVAGYIQLVANVDSEIAILDSFTRTVTVGFLVALVLSAAVSYLLSRRMVKPIAQSWGKQAEFVQNASHELRTPLSVIKTTQELLLEHPNDRIVDHFEEIAAMIEESDRLSRLAGDLLTLTALDANDAELDREKVDVDETASAMALVYREYAESQGKSISAHAESSATIMADRAKIRQLLAIVLDNAVKYTGEGDRIDVRTVSDDRQVYIFVTDTGIGVTAEDARNAFDRFYRANRAREAGGGRGLGLSIAKGIVEAHGGAIALEPNPEGKGTVVSIALPRESS